MALQIIGFPPTASIKAEVIAAGKSQPLTNLVEDSKNIFYAKQADLKKSVVTRTHVLCSSLS